jgi:signal recognition particle subunit SRP72
MGNGVIGELRVLFNRGDCFGVVSRVEQLQLRHRGANDNADRPILSAARAAALIRLGRYELAAPVVQDLLLTEKDHPSYAAVSGLAQHAQAYIAWVSNQGVSAALASLQEQKPLDGSTTGALEAQLLYRVGRYAEAAEAYRVMHDHARSAYDDAVAVKAKVGKSWRLTGLRAASSVQVFSDAEVGALRQTRDEIATNLMAALVLAGLSREALDLRASVGSLYEADYNSGCASIDLKDWNGARRALEEAERLFTSVAESELDDDVEYGLAPIRVQRAYVGHVAGEVAIAEQEYAKIVRERRADPASLAVAANNAAVAKGQLALGKQQSWLLSHIPSDSGGSGGPLQAGDDDKRSAERDRNAVLFDALKKMKATSGREVERKLTLQQRRAMARNRAILLVQMGRLDACRAEVDKLKGIFPDDALVPLIEAALVAKTKTTADADVLLRESNVSDTDVVRAARVRIALEGDDAAMAAELLGKLFPGRAAALATAAAIMENDGNVDAAVAGLRRVQKEHPELSGEAQKALASTLLRAARYEEAATVLRDILTVSPDDTLSHGQLVVATSFFDTAEAENVASQLHIVNDWETSVDVEMLESRPPPRKRDITRALRPAEIYDEVDATVIADGAGTGSSLSTGTVAKKTVKKKKTKKKRLPKNYDPNGPAPDPERWLPKTLRSSYKKKKKSREASFRGAQGADAAAADAAGIRNAERSAARVAETNAAAPNGHVPKGTKGKKKNRRR